MNSKGCLYAGFIFAVIAAQSEEIAIKGIADTSIDLATVDAWSTPFRNWHYWPKHVVSAKPQIPGFEAFRDSDVPMIFQLPVSDKWYMSFIAFDGKGYQSFVAESDNLIDWKQLGLSFGFGPSGEFDAGGRVIGAYLYDSYNLKAPRILKKREGKYWSLFGCYPRQGGYELRPGYEGVAYSEDGLHWKRAKDSSILSVHDADRGTWEKDCIYQPWLLEYGGKYYNFYGAACVGREQMGIATSTDLLNWKRFSGNPIIRNRWGGYDDQMSCGGKVLRDGDHWVMFYVGLGVVKERQGAHIMIGFSRDLLHWTCHPAPLYKAGENPSGIDKQFAHKTTIVYNPKNDTFYLYYCAVGSAGRGIGLITSKPIK